MDSKEWLEKFTGLRIKDGAEAPLNAKGYAELTGIPLKKGEKAPPNLEAAGEAADLEAAMKLALLKDAHKEIAVVKSEFQAAMNNEVKVKGKFFKQKLLDEKGTQLDEADFDEIDFSGSLKDFEPATLSAIDRGSKTIQIQGQRLKEATIERNGKVGLLFSDPEIEDGYWFPINRERILPETFIGNLYSKTRRMVNETNELYLEGVQKKKEQGQLTPEYGLVNGLLNVGSDLASLGSDMVGAFGPGTPNAQLAVDILSTLSQTLSTTSQVYDKVKDKKFCDASQLAIGGLSTITQMVLGQTGMDKDTIKLVADGFSGVQAGIQIGQKLAQGPKGIEGAVSIFSTLLQTVLTDAATKVEETQGGTPNGDKTVEALQIAAATGPTVLNQLLNGADMIKKIQAGDYAGVTTCLSNGAIAFLGTVQLDREAVLTQGGNTANTDQVDSEINAQTTSLTTDIQLVGEGVTMTVEVAIMVKQGKYLGAVNTIIQGIGEGLTDGLTQAGVDPEDAAQIGDLYQAAADGVSVIKALATNPPDVKGALGALGDGIQKAMQGAAPNNPALQEAGGEISLAISGLVNLADIKKLYDEGKYQEGADLFLQTAEQQLTGIFKLAGVEGDGGDTGDTEGGDGEDEAPEGEGGEGEGETEGEPEGGEKKPKKTKEPKEEDPGAGVAKGALKKLMEAAGSAKGDLKKGVNDVKMKDADIEAGMVLAEGKEDAAALSEAEKLGIEASDIDKLIAKMTRDRMIMKIAMQILEGGTAFLATFVPGLGAVSAGIKMAADMVAAGQRAEQLYLWVGSQQDFAAAQNALTSSAQNFVKNQGDQFTHYAVQAAFQAAQMIGNVVKTTAGVGAAAGQALESTGQVGAKLESIIYKYKKRAELENAWRITKKSFKNPSNRKLALRARAHNSTMAKYCIAWGATVKKDPLARNAVTACNLTEAVLNNEKANVNKVVEYLEKFYEDDDKLYRELEEQAKWFPTDVTLDLRCWAKIKKLAVQNIKLENPDTGLIDGQLAMLKVNLAKLDEEGVTQRIGILQSLEVSLSTYEPKAKPKDVETMKKIIAIMLRQVTDAKKAADERAKAVSEEAVKEKEKAAAKEREERAKKLADAEQALTELKEQFSVLEAFDLDDGLDELQAGLTEADHLIEDINKITRLVSNKKVQASIKQLRAKMEVVSGLIEQLETAETETTE